MPIRRRVLAKSKGSDRLGRDMADLVDAIDDLGVVLSRYRKSSVDLATRVRLGQPLDEIFPIIEGPDRPREVTETLAEFAAARHRVRLAMFLLGSEQGFSISAIGRQLGLSRQLASRLAAEANERSHGQ